MSRVAEHLPVALDVAVEQIDVSVFTVPTEKPESDATLAWDATTAIVVEARGGGRVGLGYTYGEPATAGFIRRMLADVVRGRDVMAVGASWSAMVEAVRNAGRPGAVSMAIAAVDTALWDLKARVLDVSLARLLGAVRTSVPVYGSGGFTSMTDAELVEQLSGWTAEGIPRVKMKVGTGWGRAPRRDLERAARVRDALPVDCDLFVDANGGYTAKQSARLGVHFTEIGVTWFEEPVSSDHLEELALLRELLDIDIAAGEYGYDLAYFGRMCGARAVDVVQADVTRCGGITEWLRIAALAAAHGLQISGHCAPALHAHVAAAVPNLAHVEYFADHVRVENMLFDGSLFPVAGDLQLRADGAGNGLILRIPDCERYRVTA